MIADDRGGTGRRILYLPIETKNRELFGKTLLATRAVERGWVVLMGHVKDLYTIAAHGPAGAFVEISIPENKASHLEALHERGHRIVNLCEESIVYTDGSDYCMRKVGPTSLRFTDLLFVPGERNASHLRTYRPESEGKIRITGNPRFDILQSDLSIVFNEQADLIRQRVGDFLLVNTNFGAANAFGENRYTIDDYKRRGMIRDESHEAIMRRRIQHKKMHMERTRALLADVAASRTFEKIIVRPHPVENHDNWRSWASPHGIQVHHEGNACTWMMAAEVVLHTGCTTGIEGLLLDRPVASFVPDPASEQVNITDHVSAQVGAANEFLSRVHHWRSLPSDELVEEIRASRPQLRRYIDNVISPMAVDRIANIIDDLAVPEHDMDTLCFGGIHRKLRKLGRRILSRIRYGRSARDQKFPGLVLEDMVRPVSLWESTDQISGQPSFSKEGRDLWLLH